MPRFTYLLALLLLVSTSLVAQNQSFLGYIEAGDRASQKDDHYNAYRLYQIAMEFDGGSKYEERAPEVYYKAGVAAYKTSAFEQSRAYLMQLDTSGQMEKYPLARYYLGQAQFRQGYYDQAVASFEQFLDTQPKADAIMRTRAETQIDDANVAIDMLSRSEDIQMRHLGEVNSDDSDVAYVRGPNNTRYFSSNQYEWKGDSLTPHRTISRIVQYGADAGAVPVGELINVAGKNVAHTAFNKDMTMVFYSVCDFRDYDQLQCDLYRAAVDASGNWTNPEKLDLNQAGSYTGQPSVGAVRGADQQFLYFSSDRPGGQGGKDLYRASLGTDGSLGTPENLTAINTPGDDVTPFYHEERSTLFFATDGRFTFGGLDVYRSGYAGGEWREPVNLGSPINSAADDAYYTQFDEPDQAYLASRRQTGEAVYYSDAKDVCCYDLYEFAPPTGVEIQVLTFNKASREELDGTTVALYLMSDDGPELIDELTNLEGNDFNFYGEAGEAYQLVATKSGFTKAIDEFDLSSPELVDEASVVRELYLAPAVILDVFTFNSMDDQPLPGATVKLFEVAEDGTLTLLDEITNLEGNDAQFTLEIGKNFSVEAMKAGFGGAKTSVDLVDFDPNSGSRNLRRDLYLGQQMEIYVIDGITDEPVDNATIRLQKASGRLVGEQTNPTGNDFYFTLNLDEPFYLNTTRDGYLPRQDTLTFTEGDLSDGGGKVVYYIPLFPTDPYRFLPFEVYFDNDHPDPDSYASTTDQTYEQTYYPYIDRKSAFQVKASDGLDDQQAFLTRSNIDQFFNQEVEDGWKLLSNFGRALIGYLEEGNTFNLELAGYASPRAPTEYNRRLSARRNMSLENYMRGYGDGTLGAYLDDGTISITETALGESTANLERIYERIDRERESIYSIEASLERRVVLREPESTKK